jgi:hypothetical protein
MQSVESSTTTQGASMSTISTTSLELAVRGQNLLSEAFEATKTRLARQEGQTAAEYMGLLLIVAVIIGALFAAGIGGKIRDAINTQIDAIAGGSQTKDAGGN